MSFTTRDQTRAHLKNGILLKRVKSYLRSSDVIDDERLTRIFGARLRDRRLWSFNRHGIATGTAIGLFCAFLPMPMQIVLATIGAIALRGNLPLAIALCWISNPLTWIPFYTFAFRVGEYLLGQPGNVAFSLEMFDLRDGLGGENLRQLVHVFVTLWAGCLFLGALSGCIGYFAVLNVWRLRVISQLRSRREARRRRRSINKIKQQNERELE